MSEKQDTDWRVVVLGGRVRMGWGGKNISSVLPPRGLDMWKQQGRESRCMGIQKSLHMHATER